MAVILARIWRSSICIGGTAVLLLACPLYDDSCDSRNDCGSGYRCDRFSQRCEPVELAAFCERPDQCGIGETCTPDFACRPGSCDFHGCVSGFSCGVVASTHTCVAAADAGADAAVGSVTLPDASVNGSLDQNAGLPDAAGPDAAADAADGG
jgi:hypothetical protein